MTKYYYIEKVEKVPGDGNCMFNSIWNQLDIVYKTKIKEYVKKFDNFENLQEDFYTYWEDYFILNNEEINFDKEAGFIYLRILCHLLRDSNDIRRVKHLENAFKNLINSNNSSSQVYDPKSRWGDEYDLLYIANFLEIIRIIVYEKETTLGANIYKLSDGIGFKHKNEFSDDFDEIYLIYHYGMNDGHYDYTIEKPLEFEYDGKGDIGTIIKHTKQAEKEAEKTRQKNMEKEKEKQRKHLAEIIETKAKQQAVIQKSRKENKAKTNAETKAQPNAEKTKTQPKAKKSKAEDKAAKSNPQSKQQPNTEPKAKKSKAEAKVAKSNPQSKQQPNTEPKAEEANAESNAAKSNPQSKQQPNAEPKTQRGRIDSLKEKIGEQQIRGVAKGYMENSTGTETNKSYNPPLNKLENVRKLGRQQLEDRAENKVKEIKEKKDIVKEKKDIVKEKKDIVKEESPVEEVEPEKNSNNVGKAAMLLILLFGIATIH